MAEARPRPFLDTNVLYSGLHSPTGPPGRILAAHAQGQLHTVVSPQVLEELVLVIRRKAPALLPLLHTFLVDTPPQVCTTPTLEEVQAAEDCANPSDAPILAAARLAVADCLVTGDRAFATEAAACAGLPIATPREYLQSLDH